jgi:hypothetical protein
MWGSSVGIIRASTSSSAILERTFFSLSPFCTLAANERNAVITGRLHPTLLNLKDKVDSIIKARKQVPQLRLRMCIKGDSLQELQ